MTAFFYIAGGETKPFKIGKATNLRYRWNSYYSNYYGTPNKIGPFVKLTEANFSILKAWETPCAGWVEEHIKRNLKSKRIPSDKGILTEWFDLSVQELEEAFWQEIAHLSDRPKPIEVDLSLFRLQARDVRETRVRSGEVGTPIMIRFQEDLLARLDTWRREQDDLPGRPEAIRRLIEQLEM